MLAVLEAATTPLSGKEVAELAGIPYKPTIDALGVLLYRGSVARTGAKFTAQWMLAKPQESASAELVLAMRLWPPRVGLDGG